MRRLLLMSNSKNYGQGYLEHAATAIEDFLGKSIKKVLFVPYAAVTFSFENYTSTVAEKFSELGYQIESIHTQKDPVEAVESSQAIAVGGGNTFQLLKMLYQTKVIEKIKTRVMEGMPYIGWSAGSNVACPTIKTTNDMPITEPPSFNAMGLVPFQINPHYLDTHPIGHQGETRDQRLAEFLQISPDVYVVGLREGSILRVEGSEIRLLGERNVKLFLKGQETLEYTPEQPLNFLMVC